VVLSYYICPYKISKITPDQNKFNQLDRVAPSEMSNMG